MCNNVTMLGIFRKMRESQPLLETMNFTLLQACNEANYFFFFEESHHNLEMTAVPRKSRLIYSLTHGY